MSEVQNEATDVVETVEESEQVKVKKIIPSTLADVVEPVNSGKEIKEEKAEPHMEEVETTGGKKTIDTNKMRCVDINSRVDIKTLMSKLFRFDIVQYEVFHDAMIKHVFKEYSDADIEAWVKNWWTGIKVPQASTSLSAGFDFYAPFPFTLTAGTEIIVPTGIVWSVNQESMQVGRDYLRDCFENKIHSISGQEYKDLQLIDKLMALFASSTQIVSSTLDNIGLTLQIYPRSGSAFKHNIRIANTVGIIDEDYYKSESTGGQIMIKVCMDKPRHSYPEVLERANGPMITIDDERMLKADSWKVEGGDAFAQGIVVPYIHNFEFTSDATRDGGFGSTDNKENK